MVMTGKAAKINPDSTSGMLDCVGWGQGGLFKTPMSGEKHCGTAQIIFYRCISRALWLILELIIKEKTYHDMSLILLKLQETPEVSPYPSIPRGKYAMFSIVTRYTVMVHMLYGCYICCGCPSLYLLAQEG